MATASAHPMPAAIAGRVLYGVVDGLVGGVMFGILLGPVYGVIWWVAARLTETLGRRLADLERRHVDPRADRRPGRYVT